MLLRLILTMLRRAHEASACVMVGVLLSSCATTSALNEPEQQGGDKGVQLTTGVEQEEGGPERIVDARETKWQ